jgi:parallel beta-helix repeat protein
MSYIGDSSPEITPEEVEALTNLASLATSTSTQAIQKINPTTFANVEIGNLTSITGLIVAGTNIIITGLGTVSSPYIVSSTASGGGSIDGSGIAQGVAFFSDANTLESDAHFYYNKTTDVLHVHGLGGDATDGLLIESENGTDIAIMGAANTANVTWYGSHNFSTATQDTIAAFTGAGKTLGSLALATYPSLTELSYVKGLTSSAQTQLGLLAPIANPTFTGIVTIPNTGLHLLDTNASHDLIIAAGSNLTADKTLTITTGDADVGLNLTAVTDEYLLAYDTGTNTWRGVAPAAGGGQTLYESIVAPSGGDYTTLGAALAAGKTRIFVRNGTYNETGENSIASNTIIIGESRDGVIIEVDGTTNDRFLLGNGAEITKVQISNLTFKCTVATDHILDSGNVASSGIGDLIIDNVNFNGGGIHLAANSGSTVSGKLIVNNCHFSRFTGAQAAIYCRGTAGNFDLVQITNCTTDVSTSNPALITGPVNGAEIVKFVCTGNSIVCADATTLTHSIQLDASNSTSTGFIGNNFVHGGGLFQDQGHITFTGEFSVVGNYVRTHNAGNGVGLNQFPPNGRITNNTFVDLGDGVILGTQDDNCTVSGNTFEGCTKAITINSGCTSAKITGNTFKGNTTSITDNGTTTYINDNNGDLTAVFKRSMVLMKNTSGGALAAGDVVVLKAVAAGNEVTTTTTAGDNKVYGMAYETIADTAFGQIQVLGKTTALKVDGTTDIAIGDYLTCFTTAKIAAKAVAGNMVFAMALEAYTGDDSNGVIDALLISPRLI